MFVLIEGRSVGAMVPLCEDVVVAALLDVLEATEVVVNVGKAVLMLVSDVALPLLNVRSALPLLDVAAAALLMVVGGWEGGRPVSYRRMVRRACMECVGVASRPGWTG